MNYNLTIVAGRLTRDPELRFTPKGMAIAKLGLAVNRQWKTESGEKKEEALFLDVDCFGKTAENVGQYLKKGSQLHVTGRLKMDEWTDKATGQKRSKLGVVAEMVQFLGGKSDGQSEAPRTKPAATVPTDEAPPEDDDQIVPF